MIFSLSFVPYHGLELTVLLFPAGSPQFNRRVRTRLFLVVVVLFRCLKDA